MRTVRSCRRSRGLATVLLLLALAAFLTAFVLYGALGKVSSKLAAGANDVQAFSKIDRALVRFVMTNKRLPCPAVGTLRTGLADPDAATFTCNTPGGIVPWATLGLSESDALDPWGRYISYRVFDGATGFTSATGFDTSNCNDEATLTTYAAGLCAATHENTISDFFTARGLAVNDVGTTKTGVAYVLISHGESGNGAYFPGATAPQIFPASLQEGLNAGSGGTYWVITPSTPEVPSDSTSHFDDYVTYTDASTLARASRLPRAWPLGIRFDPTSLPLINPDQGVSTLKVTSTGSALGAVTVVASGTILRDVCRVDSLSPVYGVAPCVGGSGNKLLTTASNEKLTFDFKVRRTQFLASLADFKYHDASEYERAQLTFYNGSTQVYQATVNACVTPAGPGEFGQFRLVMPSGTEFTKVDIVALNKVGGGGSDLAVSEITACHASSIAPCRLSTDSYGYCP